MRECNHEYLFCKANQDTDIQDGSSRASSPMRGLTQDYGADCIFHIWILVYSFWKKESGNFLVLSPSLILFIFLGLSFFIRPFIFSKQSSNDRLLINDTSWYQVRWTFALSGKKKSGQVAFVEEKGNRGKERRNRRYAKNELGSA